LHANLFAVVLQLADFAPELADLFDIFHRRPAASVGEYFHRQLFHEPHRAAAGLPHGA
jgi:hypothetical protein